MSPLRWKHKAVPLLAIAAVAGWAHRAVLAGQVLLTRDLNALFIPDAAVLQRALRTGHLPLWDPLRRAGQPFLATMYSQVLYPPRLLAVALVRDPARAVSVQVLGELILAGFLAFGLARALGMRRAGALTVALCWCGSGTLPSLAAEMNVASACALAPGVIWAAIALSRAPSPSRVAVLGLLFALDVLAGSPETLFWLAPMSALAAIPRHRPRSRTLLAGGAAGLLATALAAPLLAPAIEFLAHSTRARGGFFASGAWAFRAADFFELASPFARSLETSGAHYWSDQHFITSIFMGSSALALALFGLPRLARRWGAPLAVCACALMVCLGLVPANSLFRYPAKLFPGVLLGLALAAGMALDRISVATQAARFRRRLRFAPVALALVLPVLIRPSLATAGLAWSGVALALLGTALWLGRGEPRRAAGLAVCVVFGELAIYLGLFPLNVALPLTARPPSALADRVPAGTRIETAWRDEDRDQYSSGVFVEDGIPRALDRSGRPFFEQMRGDWVADTAEEDGIPQATGYGEPTPYRLHALLEEPVPPQVWQLLDVGLFVRRAAPPFPDAVPVLSPRESVLLFEPRKLPRRAWLVPQSPRVRVASEAEAWTRIRAAGFEPDFDLIVDRDGPAAGRPGSATADFASVVDDQPERVVIHAVCQHSEYLVLADAAFPGWNVEVDGAPAQPLEADGAIRAVHLCAGVHDVVWTYQPSSWRWGARIGLGALVIVLGLLGFEMRKRATNRPSVAARRNPP